MNNYLRIRASCGETLLSVMHGLDTETFDKRELRGVSDVKISFDC